MWVLCLLGCFGPLGSLFAKDSTEPGNPPATTTAPTGGTVVLAGGGAEAASDDPDGWSTRLYSRLLDGGDIRGDGELSVAILSTTEPPEALLELFVTLGADVAFALVVADAAAADDDKTAEAIIEADAVFLADLDAGAAYDAWNDTALEEALLAVYDAGGGVGGTGGGAMCLAGWALAGGQDLVARDVLEDATTAALDDVSDGGSAIHGDFLDVVPDTLIDVGLTSEGRLGRMIGAMARAVDEEGLDRVLGMGLDQRTGVVIADGGAEVIGVGGVTFAWPTAASVLQRDAGLPLLFTDIRVDRLTEGWRFTLSTLSAEHAGADAEFVIAQTAAPAPDDWSVRGDLPADAARFEDVATLSPASYALTPGDDPPLLPASVGFMDAHYPDRRAAVHETAWRALYDRPGAAALLLGWGGSAWSEDGVILVGDNPSTDTQPDLAALILSTQDTAWRALAPTPSSADSGPESLHAAALSGAVLHVLADSERTGFAYDPATGAIVGAP